ncbi:putative transcriptional regulator [Gottschalkia purinilytica]|uniref:Putative transcriptional regulator n=1 Tax=Gottschalkia purinilytica TaxID=1503 RepID=A0A0L0WF69_GOTPU|nr:helix-turn-helix transcriptional regulator [Gottschalkia purinilytica]KNF10065.1 putative transcriptional regulator [Gottschalkia purinilytica]
MGKKDNKRILGEVIKKRRIEKKLTQLKVSESTGISRNYISEIENGIYMPSVNTLFKLASFLEINLDCLLNDVNTNQTKQIYR